MAISPPAMFSQLSLPVTINNFVPLQSAQLAVTSVSSSITFTNLPSVGRVTFKLANTGSNGAYLASGNGSVTAVASTSSPQPSTGLNAVSNCDYIPAGAVFLQDYLSGTNTIAAISSASGNTTTLELSIGSGG